LCWDGWSAPAGWEKDLDVRVSWVWTVRAGRIVATQAFLEERAARAAIAPR
jgi:ketosteroid isomerase-like protein